jgi:hypothetical protein
MTVQAQKAAVILPEKLSLKAGKVIERYVNQEILMMSTRGNRNGQAYRTYRYS